MSLSNTSAIIPQLPNPSTSMAFLPPEIAYQVTISVYVVVGSMGIFVWDILDNLGQDYRLLFNYPIRIPTIAYFTSRLASLGFVLTATIFDTAPVGHCALLEKIADWIYSVGVASTALLFFFRVRAIFDRNTAVVALFGFLWLAVVAGVVTAIPGVVGANIGPTDYCIISSVQPYVAAAAIIPLVNDTLVFLAITWRLMEYAHVDRSIKTRFRILAFGDYMPTLSKALLQDGQAYYLATVTTSLMTVIMLYLKAVPPVYRTMFTVTNLTVMNVMACRVFRKTRFGLFRETEFASSGVKSMMPKDGRDKSRWGPTSLTTAASIRFRAMEASLSHILETVEEQREGEHTPDLDKDKPVGGYFPSSGTDRIV